MSQKKNSNSKNNKIKGYLKNQAANVIVYLVLFLIFSAISVAADLSKEYTVFVSFAFIGLSSFIVGFLAGIKERKNGMISGVINALPFISLLIILSIIFNGFSIDSSLFISLISGLISAAAGGIISVNIRIK